MSQYKTGTVSVTNGSSTISGAGTAWNTLSLPLYFKIDVDNSPVYQVGSIDSATQISLTANYAGSTAAGLGYQLTQDFTTNYGFPLPCDGDEDAGSWLSRSITEIDSTMNTASGTLNNDMLKKDGSVSLTGDWNFGSQTISGTGDLYTSGNVGVGTDNPITDLHIVDGAGSLPGWGTLAVLGLQNNDDATDAVGMCMIAGISGSCNIEFGDENDRNTGIIQYNNSSDYMSFTTNTSEQMRIDSSGNVGIGTTSPNERLELYNSGDSSELIRIDTNRTSENDVIGGIQFAWNGNTIGGIYSLAGPDTGNKDDGKLSLQTAKPGGTMVDRLRFTENAALFNNNQEDYDFRIASDTDGYAFFLQGSDGNVGIGTSSLPSWASSYAALQLGANTCLGNTGAYTVFSNNCYESAAGWKHINAGTAGYYRQYSGEHQFVVDSTNPGADGAMTRTYAMTIDNTGKVGLGVTDPDTLLHLEHASSPQIKLEYTSGYYATLGCGSTLFYINDPTGNPRFQMTAAEIAFNEDGLDVDFRVESDVNTHALFIQGDNSFVGLGGVPFYPFDVQTNNANDYAARIINTGDNVNRSGIRIQAGAYDGSGTTTYIQICDGDGTEVGGVEHDSGTVEFYQASDERLKCNIEDAQINGLDIINGLKLKKFNYKKCPNEPKTLGLIAQEVQPVYPTAVGNHDDMLTVRRESFIYPLIDAVQRLTEENKELRLRIEKLEN